MPPIQTEEQQYPIGKDKFGLFADSSPDRWGRVLMKRRERILADKEGIVQCPDCGKLKVRHANKEEIKEFQDRVLEADDE